MDDNIPALILIALQIATAIISLRTSVLNRKTAKASIPTIITIENKKRPSIKIALLLMFFSLSTLLYEILLIQESHKIATIRISISIALLVFSAFVVGIYFGKWVLADIIQRPLTTEEWEKEKEWLRERGFKVADEPED